jgi:superfamily II DNA or RNA helicase/HKD family nuclease
VVRRPGVYDELISIGLARELAALERSGFLIQKESVDPADAHVRLAAFSSRLLQRALREQKGDNAIANQLEICRKVLGELQRLSGEVLEDDDLPQDPPELLLAISEQTPGIDRGGPPKRPALSLSESDLLINATGEPGFGHLLEDEVPSSDRIDLICAFIRWSGIRILEGPLREFLSAKGTFRVLTTVYTGSTEREALDRLIDMGAEIKVSYDTASTRLHAKAWLFHRESGYSTAYVGSSNLSHSALVVGQEWNVRLSEAQTPALLSKFRASFDSYWAKPVFETYRPSVDGVRFDEAIQRGRNSTTFTFVGLDVIPRDHQVEMLQALQTERERHGHHRNLLVAATGTGKTIVAALDYRRLCRDGVRPPLLFVAHRKEILEQSLHAFRAVLRDGSFGELYVDGRRPEEGRHVFASIQSLSQRRLEDIAPNYFRIVIVDEFHRSAAPTYRRLLDHLHPEELLGLTATPERTDTLDILRRFEGRLAFELRLWEALEEGILCPFQYFGIHDDVDLSSVAWARGRYDDSALENLYTANDYRVRLILEEIRRRILNPSHMRALGFCATVQHAEFMAKRFSEHGLPALAVTGNTASDVRDAARRKLIEREVNVLFSVDLFNEGFDLPEIDTVLFLRPTESATVFLQQLGRGLRQSEGKDCLTVLDFIGRANRRFRFELRYRALTGASRAQLKDQIAQRFPSLPAGCSIQLDRVAQDIVLENISQAIGHNWANLTRDLIELKSDVDLATYLNDTEHTLDELYRGERSWSTLRRDAQLPWPAAVEGERELTKGLSRLLHIDDPSWIRIARALAHDPGYPGNLGLDEAERRTLEALLLTILGDTCPRSLLSAIEDLRRHQSILFELRQLLPLLESSATHLATPVAEQVAPLSSVPLTVHSRYTLDEIQIAVGRSNLANPPPNLQGGVLWDAGSNSDLFFVTLEKSERHYSPKTLYRDYAVSPDLFRWDSPHMTREASDSGQRYIHHGERGSNVLLFVRRRRKDGNRTAAYTFLGAVDYVEHTGERPMAVTWRLRRPMPADFYREAKVAAG